MRKRRRKRGRTGRKRRRTTIAFVRFPVLPLFPLPLHVCRIRHIHLLLAQAVRYQQAPAQKFNQ